jgi:cytochrome c553
MRTLLIGLLLGLPSIAAANEVVAFPGEQLEFFEKEVRPLLVERCHKCHGAELHKGNLRLDSRAAVLKGGDSGPAIDVANLPQSELLSAISYDPAGYQMPPDGKLAEAEIAILTTWVQMGAPWPAEATSTGGAAGKSWQEHFDERRKHWSFQPLVRHRLPTVHGADWCRTPVDRFLLAKLEAAGRPHAGEADRRTWLRRITLDVTGLPPTADEIGAFLADAAPGAHERVIDRLLTSPHLGERWGRHWLDLVRYAESRGHEFDYDVANPWPYRDYVIRALNGDVPYDRLVVEHVAGDLLAKAERQETGDKSFEDKASNQSALNSQLSTLNSVRLDPATGANESIVATGFWFLGEWVHSPVDIRQDEADRFENMLDVYSKTFLGLTVACARCHDHKFDPIPQTDFYALQGYLQSSTYQQVRYDHWRNNRQVAEELSRTEQEAARKLLPVFAEVVRPTVERLDQYLLAAKEVLQSVPANMAPGDPSSKLPDAERIQHVAAAYGVDAARLKSWCAHLRSSAGDDRDPFRVWARIATGQVSNAVPERRKSEAGDQGIRRYGKLRVAQDSIDHTLFANEFESDGIAFRETEYHQACIDLGSDPERPLRRIEEGGWCEYVPELGESGIAKDAMQDAAKLGALERAGRTLRTPSFEITGDKICAELRGGCHTYVVVDSHAVINGPLHGSLLQEHPAPAEGNDHWRWIQHDVSRYRGHRAHLEFVPRRKEPFAVREVNIGNGVQASSSLIPEDAALTGPDESPTLEVLARSYQQQWRWIPISIGWYLAPFRSVDCDLHTAAWALAHPQLFGLDTDEAHRRFAEVAQPLIERRNQLLAGLQRESGLAPVMLDGSGEDEYVFIRGNWKKRGEVVPRRFLSAFSGQRSANSYQPAAVSGRPSAAEAVTPGLNPALNSQPLTPNSSHSTLDTQHSTPPGSGRLQLAAQMVDPQQTPIVARVIVNRIWQHYFGRGLVPTPDDFGHLGTPPTHPELLDWLATELIAHDWSLKHIHRLILASSAYRMASGEAESQETSDKSASALEAAPTKQLLSLDSQHLPDPSNSLLSHMPVKRLEGEIIRDSILALSGRLDDELYGRSVPVHLTSFLEGRGRPGESGPVDGRGRRSLYIAVRRNFPDPFFQAFDFPNPHSTIGRRNVSNVPAQALALMNNPLVLEQCRVAAERLLRETAGQPPESLIEWLYQQIYCRPPQDEEQAAGGEFIAGQATALQTGLDDPRVWADYIHVLLNAKEFIFVR